MQHDPIMTFMNTDGSKRVDIYQRPDGNYAFIELQAEPDKLIPKRETWSPCSEYADDAESTLQAAFQQAKQVIPWLSQP